MSRTNERVAIPTSLISADDVRALASELTVIEERGGGGGLPILSLLKVMPLRPDQRAILERAWPGELAVECYEQRCAGDGWGESAEATMHVSIGVISNPTLVLGDHIETRIKRRGPAALEFCDVVGMSVRKGFISRPVQGLYIEADGDAVYLTVDMGSDDDNYDCE